MELYWNLIFFVCLGVFAYLVNKVFKMERTPKIMCNVFTGIVFVMWVLQLFGIGK